MVAAEAVLPVYKLDNNAVVSCWNSSSHSITMATGMSVEGQPACLTVVSSYMHILRQLHHSIALQQWMSEGWESPACICQIMMLRDVMEGV